MSARSLFVLCMIASSLLPAAAQPRIAPGDMAGRERERFIEHPSERFMKPGPYEIQPLIEPAPKPKKPRHRKRR